MALADCVLWALSLDLQAGRLCWRPAYPPRTSVYHLRRSFLFHCRQIGCSFLLNLSLWNTYTQQSIGRSDPAFFNLGAIVSPDPALAHHRHPETSNFNSCPSISHHRVAAYSAYHRMDRHVYHVQFFHHGFHGLK